MKYINLPFENAVIADTHSSQYLMHKYWARKPANIVSEYIKYFTDEGDLVFDPFGGSGVTVIEAAKLGRKAIYNDLSQTSKFIAEQTLMNYDDNKIFNEYNSIIASVKNDIQCFYSTKCSKCNQDAIITHTIWSKDKINNKDRMELVKTKCENCGKKIERSPTEADVLLLQRVNKIPIKYWYPKERMIANGRLLVAPDMKVCDLFTHRALLSLSIIWANIENIRDTKLKNLFRFIFTSSLSQASKLVPVISSAGRKNEVGSWSFPGFWIPDRYFEINVLNTFSNRYGKIRRGKEIKTPNADNVRFINQSATNLNNIESESIDYIFTDPPYGDSVPYFEYELLWSSWLKHKLDFKNEIVISDSKERNKDIDNYRMLLKESFAELYRVLKSKGWLTVTFHNNKIKVWNALVSSAIEAGFSYENDCYAITGRLSTNQLTRKAGSMTGDIYINFRKHKKLISKISKEFDEVKLDIFNEAEKIIIERGGQATTDQLARGILMKLSKHNLFGKVIDLKITDILKEQFDYNQKDSFWTLKEKNEAKLLEYIPLETRIGTVIDSVLNQEKNSGYDIDEFLVPIFTRYKNGRTPDTKEIITILKAKADEKKGKWFPPLQQELFPSGIAIQELKLSQEELLKCQTEHNSIIYQLAKIGLKQNYNIWIGDNEKRKSKELFKMSTKELIIPGLSENAIRKSRINQIDLIWMDKSRGIYILFEVENSTKMINCIPRLANLTEQLPNLRIPIYIIIPENTYKIAKERFRDPSNIKLINSDRYIIRYGKLFDHIDLLENDRLNIADFLGAVSERV